MIVTPDAKTGSFCRAHSSLREDEHVQIKGDGSVDGRDAVFASPRLWRDADHDGVSQPGELHTLAGLGLSSVGPDHRESGRRDAHGNRFHYRAKVTDARGAQLGRWAWDVFLVSGP